jgi:hypothetical protein
MFEGYLAMLVKDITKPVLAKLDTSTPCDHMFLATLITEVLDEQECPDIRSAIIAACEIIRSGHAEIIEAMYDEQVFGGPE